MEVEVSEIKNLSEEDETVTLGAPHPGLRVFQLTNALQYFNEESIIKEELKDVNINLYLEKKNICFAIEKIFDIKMSQMQQWNDTLEDIDKTPGSSSQLTSTGGTNSYISKHAQIIQRFRLDQTLPENDLDSSVCVSLSSSITDTPPSTIQEEPNASEMCESESTPLDDETHDLSANLVSLFRLMSVLPEPAATRCKQVLDKDQFDWKVTLHDIIFVLLNWGATLQSLCLEDITMPKDLFSLQLPRTFDTKTNNKNNFPVPSNVVLVLNSICQRLPHPSSSQMPCSHRALLVKVMMYAALDHGHRRYLAQYCRTIRSVLETFPSWGEEEANAIVNLLQLDRLELQNSVFVCCSLFNMTCSRLSLVGLLASHKVLHQQFGLPAEVSFSNLIKHLLRPPELLKKFKLWHVYIITCLVHSLLIRNACQTPPCFKEAVAALQQWTVDVRSALTQYPYMYTLASSHVRERLSRMTAECAVITRGLN